MRVSKKQKSITRGRGRGKHTKQTYQWLATYQATYHCDTANLLVAMIHGLRLVFANPALGRSRDEETGRWDKSLGADLVAVDMYGVSASWSSELSTAQRYLRGISGTVLPNVSSSRGCDACGRLTEVPLIPDTCLSSESPTTGTGSFGLVLRCGQTRHT